MGGLIHIFDFNFQSTNIDYRIDLLTWRSTVKMFWITRLFLVFRTRIVVSIVNVNSNICDTDPQKVGFLIRNLL